MTDDFLNQVKSKGYWQAGEQVVLGVSGGVDSMVLFDMLNHLPLEYKPAIIVAHINHHLRNDSDEEEAFIKEWVGKYDVPVNVYQWPKSEHPESGVEKEARKIRYQFFGNVAKKINSSFILTAHHRDDQVETVLMRFVKGSSLDELTGIAATRMGDGEVVLRLLLPYSKEMIRKYAEENRIPWREDESNTSMEYTRNRYRHHIIPELKKENPAVEKHVYEFSKDIEDLLKVVEPLINEEISRSFQITRKSLSINLPSFLKQESGFQKIVLRRAFKKFSGQGAYIISQTHINLLVDWFVSGGPNTVLELPNQFVARKEYGTCVIEKVEDTLTKQTDLMKTPVTLELGKWIPLNDNESIGLFSYDAFKKMDSQKYRVIYLNEEQIEHPLTVRHRKPGDKMKVKGLEGSKKIKDIFIDQKVPKRQRDEAWLVKDNQGQIIWLINYKESPLSRNPLTDTISYVLVYQKETIQN